MRRIYGWYVGGFDTRQAGMQAGVEFGTWLTN
jgi:hypothetical protein